jgi:hypothetical protein
MSLIHEIRKQSLATRRTLMVLSVFLVVSAVGFYWFAGLQRDVFFSLNDDPAARDAFVAQQDDRSPQPLALIGKALGKLTASIGSLIGFDSSKGFDRNAGAAHTADDVHLLPLSQ